MFHIDQLVRPALVGTFVIVQAGQGFAATGDPGEIAAQACYSCHGANGQGGAAIPAISGQSEAELLQKLQDYAAGTLPGTIMPRIASGYSGDEMAEIAAWLSKVTP